MVWKGCSLSKALIEAGRGERKENQAPRKSRSTLTESRWQAGEDVA